MARSAESTTEANASSTGTGITAASSTVAAAGNQDSVGEGADMLAVETRLIQ